MLSDLINEFQDRINLDDYYKYSGFEKVKDDIIYSQSNILFLLGEPGSGKSFLLKLLQKEYPQKYILQTDPFFSKEEFLEIHNDISGKIVLMDEAQLLSIEMIEFLRLLSDKGVQVVLSMHKKEGEKIISYPQFKSRYVQKLYMPSMEFEEVKKYVFPKFIKHNKHNLIDEKSLKKIYSFTKGNFRFTKKFVFTSLLLLEFSLKNVLKYTTIDKCIIEMAAIELGLLK